MAVAHDAYSDSGGFTNSPVTWTHTPTGTVRGVAVLIAGGDSSADNIASVTYGGQALTRKCYAHDDFGEQGSSFIYFLGTVPSAQQSGAQSVVVTPNAFGNKRAVCVTVTASGDCDVTDPQTLYDTTASDLANPSVSCNSGANTAQRYVVFYSGQDDLSSFTPNGNTTNMVTSDVGTFCFLFGRETTPSAGSTALGWTVAADDYAMSGIDIYQSGSGTTATQTIPAKASVTVSTTKDIPAKADIVSTGTTSRAIVAKANIVPIITSGNWVAQTAPTQIKYGSFTGSFSPQKWNSLSFNSSTGEMLLYDGYAEPVDPYKDHIWANSLWSYNLNARTLKLIKVGNWGYSSATGTYALPANTTDPTPWDRHPYGGMATYVSATDSFYLSSGANASQPGGWIGDLWAYDMSQGQGGSWRLVALGDDTPGNDAFPVPYTAFEQLHAQYSPTSGVIIMHSARLDRGFESAGRDTISFDVATERFTNKTPNGVGSPGAYMGHTLTYDSARNYVWMFGGSAAAPYPQYSSDLWRYDVTNNQWTQYTQASTGSATWPSARRFANWAYDSTNDVILMFGGVTGSSTSVNDTWVFKPSTSHWQQLAPTDSPPVPASILNAQASTMAYDSINNWFVLLREGVWWQFRFATTGPVVKTIPAKANIKATTIKNLPAKANITVGGQTTKDIVAKANISRAGFSYQLTANEVLTLGQTGLNRTNAPITVGLPIPDSQGIANVNQLGMSGPTAYQFRPLGYHKSGNLKWVLCDWQDSVTANGTSTAATLTTGSGSTGGANLAASPVGFITVGTGSAFFNFTTSTPGFRMFDTVQLGSTVVQSVGTEGIVVVSGGVRYTSANDTSAVLSIEENGPVRCCIKATGSLKNGSGTRLCDFVVRMHFYRNKTYCRTFVSLKNAALSPKTAFTFDSAEVNVKVVSGAHFSTQTSLDAAIGADIGPTETAYVYQAYSTQWGYGQNDYGFAPINTTTQRGVEVKKVGGTTYRALTGSVSDYATGWAALEDPSGAGVTVGMRYMAQKWPAGFELSGDGTASVQLFSKRNPKTGLKFAYGAYETRELMFDYHTSAPASRATFLYDMQHPVSARGPLSQYNESGAICGETKLVSEDDQRAFFFNHLYNTPSLINVTPQLWRYHAWDGSNSGGGDNQTDFARIDFTDWVRTGRGGFLIQGEHNSWYKADNAFLRTDGYAYYDSEIDPGDESGGINSGAFNGRRANGFEHPHWHSMAIGYYLTGHEGLNEACRDFAEWKYGMATAPINFYLPFDSAFGNGGMRMWSYYLRDFTLSWEFLRESRYYNYMSQLLTALLNSRDSASVPGTFGRNLDRGYIWMFWDSNQITTKTITDFMWVQIHFETLWEVRRILIEEGDSRLHDLEDYMLGLVDFFYNEMFFDFGPAQLQYGYLYGYYLAQANAAGSPYWPPLVETRPISTARAFQFGYEMTGNAKYLDRAARLIAGDVGAIPGTGPYVTSRTASDYPSQGMMYDDLYRPETGYQTVAVSAADNGGGSWTLTWTAPSNATGYIIRYSTKTIVDWLGFNQATRVYQFDPSTNVAWFAATRYASPPTPATGGATETLTITGLTPGTTYNFAIKYSTSTPAASVTTTRTILAKAAIHKTTTQTLPAKATVTVTVTKDILAMATIVPSASTRVDRAIPAKANVRVTTTKDIPARAYIRTPGTPTPWTEGSTPGHGWKRGNPHVGG